MNEPIIKDHQTMEEVYTYPMHDNAYICDGVLRLCKGIEDGLGRKNVDVVIFVNAYMRDGGSDNERRHKVRAIAIECLQSVGRCVGQVSKMHVISILRECLNYHDTMTRIFEGLIRSKLDALVEEQSQVS